MILAILLLAPAFTFGQKFQDVTVGQAVKISERQEIGYALQSVARSSRG
jgi:hypothetical protein